MRRSAITVLCLCTSCLFASSAYATGYGLREFSISALGTSYAGAAANGEHASTLAFNPALLSDVQDFDVSTSATGILPQATGTFTAYTSAMTPIAGIGNPKDIVNTALVGSLSVRKRLTDTVTVGLVFTTPWGMITNYEDNWVGRYYATMSNVKSYDFIPMVAYQPIPELSIGLGVQIQYTKGQLGKAIDFGTIGALYEVPGASPGNQDGYVMLSANDWSEGFVAGVTYKPSDDLTLGLSYRSKINHKLTGAEHFDLSTTLMGQFLSSYTGMFVDSAASAPFVTPTVITFGARWKVDDQWTLGVGGDWTGWSAFKTLAISSGNPLQGTDLSQMKWKDSWFGSVGVEYRPVDALVLRFGTAYDETPTINNYRTPGIPDSSRYWLSGGVGYRWNEHIDIDMTYAHLFSSKAHIALSPAVPGNEVRGGLNGTTSMGVNLIGVEFTYHQ